MAQLTRTPFDPKGNPGPYLGQIINHLDTKYMGAVEVDILKVSESGNNPELTGQVTVASYLSPFYGVTPVHGNTRNPDFKSTQQSYGMWAVPPDVGTKVLVIFPENNAGMAYWFGCVQDPFMNFMVPGLASTTFNSESTEKVLPVAEYNKLLEEAAGRDTTKFIKPVNPFIKSYLEKQGLAGDVVRGTTTSSARREVPSHVFGWSTPGPYDRTSGAPRSRYGGEGLDTQVHSSRLGGSTFVMDDGDSSLIRKGPPSGPEATGPIYVNKEAGETGGDPTLPANDLVRLRTRTGHQILMHNSEDLIYIGNAKGSTWIELTSNGKIDIFANDSVSIHTTNDLNVTADRDIIMSAGRNICLTAGNDGRITAGQGTHISAQTHTETALGGINMNGPTASPAYGPMRTPQHEPWFGHENLAPTEHTPEKTDADPEAENTADETGNNFVATEYPPVPDTFRKSV